MRYRPFGRSGAAVSCVTLSIGSEAISRGPQAGRELIYSALETGINSYKLESADPVLAEVVGEALKDLDRKLVTVSMMLGAGDGRRGSLRDFSAEGMTGAIDKALQISGLGWIDVAILDEPGEDELAQSSLNALKALRTTERIKLLGIAGDSEVMDTYVSTGAFDLLVTGFHVNSPWQVRSRVRAAREQDMVIFANDYFPASLDSERKASSVHVPKKKGLFGFGGGPKAPASPLTGAGTFAFLHRTQGWTAEEVCLAHCMTDPSIASVIIEARDEDRLNALAKVPERDMPPGLSAQIEMARIATAA